MPPENTAFPPFDALVETHSRELFSYLWRILQNEQDAEDCLQETFLKAFRAYSGLTHADNLRAWLYKIATNTARNHHRRNSRTPVESMNEDEELGSRDQDPAHVVAAQLSIRQVKQAVMALPEKQRVAIVLSRFQDLPYSEVASVMGISEEAVRANVYQAARKLRSQVLAEELEHA
ncbi:MAG: RNA polymerase sigma factor [Chloroflexi bacterium]|nr:RNA polymerase sigma factor [Chloroflexota bacterium]